MHNVEEKNEDTTTFLYEAGILLSAFTIMLLVSWFIWDTFINVPSAVDVVNQCAFDMNVSSEESQALARETTIWLHSDPSLKAYTWKLDDLCESFIEDLRTH